MCHLEGVLSGYTYISSYVTYTKNSEESEGLQKKLFQYVLH